MFSRGIDKVKERMASACALKGRQPQEVMLVAVSKGRSVAQIQEAVSLGVADIGENKVQEALLKYNGLRGDACLPGRQGRRIRWHMVGHLQTNKVKDAVGIFDMIHSVDSLRLALEIDRQAAKINKVQEVLIEVKTSPEATKFGIGPEEVPALLKEISALKNIKVGGLMTIAPFADDPQKARPYFRMLRQLRDTLNGRLSKDDELRILSMGMSDDFEVAVEEGATMVRIGRAIFES